MPLATLLLATAKSPWFPLSSETVAGAVVFGRTWVTWDCLTIRGHHVAVSDDASLRIAADQIPALLGAEGMLGAVEQSTQPSPESPNPQSSGREPGTIQTEKSAYAPILTAPRQCRKPDAAECRDLRGS